MYVITVEGSSGAAGCRFGQNIVLPFSHTHTHTHRAFRAQADSTLTHTSHKDTEQSTTEASITLDGVTLTDPLIR
jgi:hypothetical protein